METALDKFGRIVVPKEVRLMLGLSPGDHLDVAIKDGALVLSPRRPKGKLVRRKGLLLHETGTSMPLGLTERLLEASRKEREGRILGEK